MAVTDCKGVNKQALKVVWQSLTAKVIRAVTDCKGVNKQALKVVWQSLTAKVVLAVTDCKGVNKQAQKVVWQSLTAKVVLAVTDCKGVNTYAHMLPAGRATSVWDLSVKTCSQRAASTGLMCAWPWQLGGLAGAAAAGSLLRDWLHASRRSPSRHESSGMLRTPA